MMKNIFYLMFLGLCLTSTLSQATPQFSEADLKASEIAKTVFQNEISFKNFNLTQQAAFCTGAIASFQTCLSGQDSGDQVLQTSKILFEQIYGDLNSHESYFKAGEVYGYLLSATTQKCDSISEFTNNNCQEMMQRNVQYIQENFRNQ